MIVWIDCFDMFSSRVNENESEIVDVTFKILPFDKNDRNSHAPMFLNHFPVEYKNNVSKSVSISKISTHEQQNDHITYDHNKRSSFYSRCSETMTQVLKSGTFLYTNLRRKNRSQAVFYKHTRSETII